VHLTEAGARWLEKALGGIDLYAEENVATILTEVNVALHAHVLLQRDVHYIVRDGAVQLINASRGRIAALQRWPDGLQAAVEAKEGIETTETGEVLDTITVQALINRYPTVCGMTGTALAAGEQLRQFYKLGVSPIPPNAPNVRVDEPDRVYLTAAAKNEAIIDHIIEVHATGQPILVGTQDVAESEDLHARLTRRGVPAVVLNAKNDEEEAGVIAEAGKLGVVTVSTQMAGRGTDIRLGGSDETDHDAVAELGGLHLIGTGRHRTERLDNQLRGRAGRQGDSGSSVFFASWEDDVVEALLSAALSDDSPVLRRSALRGLARRTTRSARMTLERRLGIERDVETRALLEQAIIMQCTYRLTQTLYAGSVEHMWVRSSFSSTIFAMIS
jgi:preprotein translocase subunit SecA